MLSAPTGHVHNARHANETCSNMMKAGKAPNWDSPASTQTLVALPQFLTLVGEQCQEVPGEGLAFILAGKLISMLEGPK